MPSAHKVSVAEEKGRKETKNGVKVCKTENVRRGDRRETGGQRVRGSGGITDEEGEEERVRGRKEGFTDLTYLLPGAGNEFV